jgi:hypothetical protein
MWLRGDVATGYRGPAPPSRASSARSAHQVGSIRAAAGPPGRSS